MYNKKLNVYFFMYIIIAFFVPMTVKEFLQAKTVNISIVAKRMWPKNKTAELYLYKKLSGERPFTKKDSERAISVLKELSIQIENLTID